MDIWAGKCVKWEDDRIVLDKYGMVIYGDADLIRSKKPVPDMTARCRNII